VADVYRWTGHFPDDSRLLLRHLADRADHLQLRYPEELEYRVVVGLTTLVAALAMNHVHTGTYFPEPARTTPAVGPGERSAPQST